MLIINHQEAIEIFKKENQVIEIKQYSHPLGCDVSILIQPENVQQFCLALSEEAVKDVIE